MTCHITRLRFLKSCFLLLHFSCYDHLPTDFPRSSAPVCKRVLPSPSRSPQLAVHCVQDSILTCVCGQRWESAKCRLEMVGRIDQRFACTARRENEQMYRRDNLATGIRDKLTDHPKHSNFSRCSLQFPGGDIRRDGTSNSGICTTSAFAASFGG